MRCIYYNDLLKKIKKSNIEIKNKMGFESFQLKNVDIIETHPGRVTRKDVSMEGMVRPISSVVHSGFYSFTNPQMHERRPNPLRFHRQMKFFQAAYHRSAFARYIWSQKDNCKGIVTRHPLSILETSALCGTSV